MSAAVVIDDRSYRAAMAELRQRFPEVLRKLTEQRFKLAIRDCMRWTAPYPRGAGGSTSHGAKKAGEAAIESDLKKVFVPMHSREMLESLAEAHGTKTKSGGVSRRKTRAAARKIPGVIFDWQGNDARIAGQHKSYRGSRGHVRNRRGGDVKIGNFTLHWKMYIPQAAYRRYLRKVQSRVGRLKAGWLAAFQKVGGKAPAWITRHGTMGGSASISDAKRDVIEAAGTNSVGYGDYSKMHAVRMAKMFHERMYARDVKFAADYEARKFSEHA